MPVVDHGRSSVIATAPDKKRKGRRRRNRQHEPQEAVEEEYAVEIERLASQNLNEEKLRRVLGSREGDLAEVEEIRLKLNSKEMFFANVGELLPRLSSLTLDDSEIKSLRDLGTGLNALKILSLSRCGLADLDGLAAFPGLRELVVADNKIANLDPLFHHESLQVLDASDNLVATLMDLEVLGTCTSLYRLELVGNPLKSCFEEDMYRRLVSHYVANLKVLDGHHITRRSFKGRKSLTEKDLVSAASALEKKLVFFPEHGAPRSQQNTVPWQEVLGSRRSRRSSSSSKTVSTSLLDHDPSASALTLGDQEPFSGSALAIMRSSRNHYSHRDETENSNATVSSAKQQDSMAAPLSQNKNSVLSTLDQAKEMDHDSSLQRLRQISADESISPRRLAEWQAETLVESTPETSPGSPPQVIKPLFKKKQSNGNRPHTAPLKSQPLLPQASQAESKIGGIRPQSSSVSTVRATEDDLAVKKKKSPVMTSLPQPVMFGSEDPQGIRRRRRPVSRRRSRRRRLVIEESDDDEEDEIPTPAFGILEMAPPSTNSADENLARCCRSGDLGKRKDDDDQIASLTRSAIKARAAARRCHLDIQEVEDYPASPAKPRASASHVGSFDLKRSLAALSQWSDAAADADDGAVRFDSCALRTQQRPFPAENRIKNPPDDENDGNNDVDKKPANLAEKADIRRGGVPIGAALSLDDQTLIAMLRQPPKAVRHLRTRDGFVRFFTGISKLHMQSLLRTAFENEPKEEARRRFEKRMELLSNVMV